MRMTPSLRGSLVPLVLLVLLVLLVPSLDAQILPCALKSADLWFDAKASLGPFRGITHEARGETAGAQALSSVRGFVELQAKSITTNNGLRDRDMRSTLEVDKYPTIRFDLDSMAVGTETPDSARVELAGRISIHGVTHAIRVPAMLRRQRNEVRVTGSFELFLPNYGVTKLKRMLGMLSMEPTIQVGLEVTFNSAREGAE